jgi:hypothetical protein
MDMREWSAEALTKRLNQWIAEGGLGQLQDTRQRDGEVRAEIREALQPDPEALRKPTTI